MRRHICTPVPTSCPRYTPARVYIIIILVFSKKENATNRVDATTPAPFWHLCVIIFERDGIEIGFALLSAVKDSVNTSPRIIGCHPFATEANEYSNSIVM